MRPAQFATQGVVFSRVGKGQVELHEIPEIGDGHALAEFLAECAGKVADELAAVFGASGTGLFFLNDATTDAPVCVHHGRIDGGVSFSARIAQDGADIVQHTGWVWHGIAVLHASVSGLLPSCAAANSFTVIGG